MRLNGCEYLCLHLEIVLHTSATPHCSFSLELCQRQEKFLAQVLCQGELEKEGGEQPEKCLNTFSLGLSLYVIVKGTEIMTIVAAFSVPFSILMCDITQQISI